MEGDRMPPFFVRVRENLATVTLRPAQLWTASAAAWAAAGAAAAGAGEDAYTALTGVALVVTLAALQSVAITRRLDRQYTAMMQAAIRLRISAPLQVVPQQGDVPEGVVVSLRDKVQPVAVESAECSPFSRGR